MKLKNVIITIVSILFIGFLLGKLDIQTNPTGTTKVQASKVSHSQNKKKKDLIIYFSLSGTTKKAAEQIKKDTGADIVRLEPKKAYPNSYDAAVPVAKKEMQNKKHPAIKSTIPNLKKYDTIYIGFPTWWRQPPMIIHSLFDKYDFSNKKIVPFTTSMESPISKSMPYMKTMADNDHATLLKGFRYNDNNTSLKKFLKKNDLIK